MFPPSNQFKKECEQLNGKQFSWNEIQNVKGYCLALREKVGLELTSCTNQHLEKTKTNLSIRTKPKIENVWVCQVENVNGKIQSKIMFFAN
jgi:hypothetical protein